MSDQSWTIERIRQELSEVRTRLFVMGKVLESGTIKPEDHPEWMLVLRPMLTDVASNFEKVRAILDKPQES
jgi:hypothetical protein